jgi:hypothetical protein
MRFITTLKQICTGTLLLLLLLGCKKSAITDLKENSQSMASIAITKSLDAGGRSRSIEFVKPQSLKAAETAVSTR